MKSRRIALLVVVLGIAAVTQSGCGTFANLNGSPTTLMQVSGIEEPEYFGGVKRYAGTFPFGLIGDGSLISAVDIPLSLVGDIITLPLVHRMKNNPDVMKAWTGRTFGENDPAPTLRSFPYE